MFRRTHSTRSSPCDGAAAHWLPAAVCAVLCLAGRAGAEDTVYFSAASTGPARTKAIGRIVDYNGRELVLETGSGEKRFPAEQIAGFETEWTPAQQAADELAARGEFAAAVPKYEEALRSESRRWAQRKIVVEMINCLRNLGELRRAGELFLSVARDDPALLDLAAIPLAWLPGQPPADLEKKSAQWLASDVPVAVLLGASHLLSTGDRAAIVKRLERVATSKAPRIAALARALIWNATYASASAAEVATWSSEVETFPEAVRAGPYFVLGRALAQQKQPAAAAMSFLRVPILYPSDRPLAAASLLAAGQALEQAAEPESAARLYRELLAEHPQSRAAAEARQRVQKLGSKAAADGGA